MALECGTFIHCSLVTFFEELVLHREGSAAQQEQSAVS